MYQYTYLIASLGFVPFWLIFYWLRPDLRKILWKVSILGGFLGLIDVAYIADWWTPDTVLGTTISLESIIFSFFLVGSLSICSEVLLKKAYVPIQSHPALPVVNKRALGAGGLIFFLVLFKVFSIHSFVASVIAIGCFTTYMLILRKDLRIDALVGAGFGTLLGMVWFSIAALYSPGWVEATWLFDNVTGYYFIYEPLHEPIEDFVWFLIVGAMFAPLYKFGSSRLSQGRYTTEPDSKD